MSEAILVINAGSTSVKFAAYAVDVKAGVSPICQGEISGMPTSAHFVAWDAHDAILDRRSWPTDASVAPAEALKFIVSWLEAKMKGLNVVAAGHRILLSGPRYKGPIVITSNVLDDLESLSEMEPSHQAMNVAGARVLAGAYPGLTQVACFDNSFHLTMPDVAQAYALPKDVRDAGVRHWGYHGISFEYVAGEMARVAPEARRVVIAHLGGGSSLCALLDGKSIDTSMGLGCLSGLPMARRSGDIPPEALLYLLRASRFDVTSLEAMLYDRSGLLGLSGISDDMKVLQDSTDPGAILAFQHFVYALTKYVGAYAAALGGLDALVFTGGMGERSPPVRAALCARLAWLGVSLDGAANATHANRISAPDSRVCVHVIPTNEEQVIARHTWALLQGHTDPSGGATSGLTP